MPPKIYLPLATFTRRTSEHCLRTFRTVHFLHHPVDCMWLTACVTEDIRISEAVTGEWRHRSSIICTFHHSLQGRLQQGCWDEMRMLHAWQKIKMHSGFWYENRKKRMAGCQLAKWGSVTGFCEPGNEHQIQEFPRFTDLAELWIFLYWRQTMCHPTQRALLLVFSQHSGIGFLQPGR
jgi:hypothetical protein